MFFSFIFATDGSVKTRDLKILARAGLDEGRGVPRIIVVLLNLEVLKFGPRHVSKVTLPPKFWFWILLNLDRGAFQK